MPGKTNGSARPQRQERRGRLWKLPKETCAICYLRLRPTIDHQLGLPALQAPSGDAVDPQAVRELMHDTTHNELDSSETEVHLPTRTDCTDGCVYCYYCIAQELSALAKEAGSEEEGRRDKPREWKCLRCGEEVFACHRVVEDRIEPTLDTTDKL